MKNNRKARYRSSVAHKGPASDAQSSKERSRIVKPVKDIAIGQESETSSPRTNTADSSEMRPSRTLEGQLERRKWRRRNNISSLPGLIREHSRVIGAIHNGRVDLAKGEVLSRAYGRHREMVTALEQRELLLQLNEKLEQLRGASALQQLAAPGGSA